MSESDQDREFENETEQNGDRRGASKAIQDMIKKLLYSGMGAVFTSEESIRRVASEMTLPKEAVTYLVGQAQSTKNELFRIVANEFRDFLESVNFGQEVQKILTSLTFEIKMQVRLLPSDRDDSVKPSIKGNLKVVKNGETPTEPAE